MRQTRKSQLALGEARIEDIKLNHKSRDDIPAVLLGLQHLYSNEETREKLFSLLEEHILPGTNRNVGRPGMELWRVLVMGVLKQGLGCDFDRLQELVNEHRTVREFLGHGAFSQDETYELQTIIDNVYLLTPELLSEIGRLVVESGHTVARKKPGEALRGRCDSFVVETDVHYPTDVNPNVAINVVCHAAFSRYFKDLMVGIAVLFNLTCGESERQSKIDTRSCEIGDLPTIG